MTFHPPADAAAEAKLSPGMQQYWTAKRAHPDALLFFRMGDFYELFYDDALTASRELQLTLTARDRDRAIPMCGVPYHAVENYLQRLLRKGYRIAICEQMEDPKLTKKIVRREVTRVLTPGTALDSTLDQSQNNFLAALHQEGPTTAIALLDLSTGDFRAAEYTGLQQAIEELLKAQPSELLLSSESPETLAPELERSGDRTTARTRLDDWIWTREYAIPLLERKLGVHSLEGFGLTTHPAAAIAAGVILHYVQTTQKLDALHLDSLRFVEHSTCLQLDPVSVRNLELVEPLTSGSDSRSTLFHALDHSCTPMGKRLLRATILRPLYDAAEINRRYQAVAEALQNLILREDLRRSFSGLLDLERLLARLSLDSAGPRDLAALAASLSKLPAVQKSLQAFQSPLWTHLTQRLDPLTDIASLISKTIVPEPPLTLADGGAIAPGIHAELDDLRSISSTGRQSIAAIEERERARTGINSLKVRYNNVFGYYIELTKANAAQAPSDYERKQTLVNAERFTTPELKEYEVKVLTAHDRAIDLEKQLFAQLRTKVLESASRIRLSSAVVAESDLLANFAHLAAIRNYTRPELDSNPNAEPILEVVAGRHPVIETTLSEINQTRFIPNSLYLQAHDHAHNPAQPASNFSSSNLSNHSPKQPPSSASQHLLEEGLVTGHDFSRAENASSETPGLQPLLNPADSANPAFTNSAAEIPKIEEAAGHPGGFRGLKAPENPPTTDGALEAAEKLNGEGFVKGHDLSRADKANQINRALAPEGCFFPYVDAKRSFSAASLATETFSPTADGHSLQEEYGHSLPEGYGLQPVHPATQNGGALAPEANSPSLLLITGPNMGGKSTYLRQAAMLTLMAQMGSFVPATRMRYGLVDRIYTRIGASDNVARGRSTFMVEMTETATILNTATSRSLVLLDEMGRGTATFDGLSLAWATVEYLHAEIGARTLFATHYHELTLLAEKLPRVTNLRVAVKETSSGIVFLHSIEPGAASKSYGIDVAKLAGLPRPVIDRARHILRQHEKQERRSVQTESQPDPAAAEPMQLTIFTPLSQRIVDRLASTDINSLTPLQALNLLEELKQELNHP